MINITITDMETMRVLQNTYADRIIGFTEDVRCNQSSLELWRV